MIQQRIPARRVFIQTRKFGIFVQQSRLRKVSMLVAERLHTTLIIPVIYRPVTKRVRQLVDLRNRMEEAALSISIRLKMASSRSTPNSVTWSTDCPQCIRKHGHGHKWPKNT